MPSFSYVFKVAFSNHATRDYTQSNATYFPVFDDESVAFLFDDDFLVFAPAQGANLFYQQSYVITVAAVFDTLPMLRRTLTPLYNQIL
jgi:hypothetical protein